METNLRQMSIKDYFKYLYDHILENLKIGKTNHLNGQFYDNRFEFCISIIDPPGLTILSRLPILCLNNNKSIGAYDHLEFETYHDIITESGNDATSIGRENGGSLMGGGSQQNPQLIQLNSSSSSSSLGANAYESTSSAAVSSLNSLEHLSLAFDHALSSNNVRRPLECTLNSLLVTRQLDIEWLKANETFVDRQARGDAVEPQNDQERRFVRDEDELTLAWLFHARQVLHTTTSGDLIVERVLNVLSNALEANPRRELVWLLYLQAYLCKRNAHTDYHEICLLCMDNLVTYDLVWLILNTCPAEYVELVVDRYEKFLLSCSHADLILFEQLKQEKSCDQIENSSDETNATKRVSYYLFELILFNVYFHMNSIHRANTTSSESTDDSAQSENKETLKSGLVLAKDYLNKYYFQKSLFIYLCFIKFMQLKIILDVSTQTRS